ncbi:uncharacterized protein LOC141538344 isoform X2 [Cotesia typhae]|uniref:uncharacterized protein LOC141538344 isoform X2 n=1 Tax=Cotesia typhae TaxID=2053667 RepID=UPI003D6839A9
MIVEASFDTCPDLGRMCHADQSPLCCNNRAICRVLRTQTSSEKTFICSIPAKLGEFCLNDIECLRLDNAFCWTELHQCNCLTGYGELNKNGRCVPLIGGVCRVDAECQVPHAICVESKCQCREKFIKISQTQCVQTSIGRRCEKDLDCNDILHVGCSVGGKCVCKDNHILLNNSKCAPLLGEFCWSDERCAVDNSVCFQNSCQCKTGYTFENNTYCSKLFLLGPEVT